MVGSASCIKRFTTGSINSLKDIRKLQMMPDHVQKWLRQQSRDFYAVGFDALVKQWDKGINVSRGYVEKEMFFQVQTSPVLYPFVTHLLTLLRTLD
jgi:hypothetical protein